MSSFKTSINIKYDFGEVDLIDRYLPTPSHAEALKGLLRGFNNKNNSRSHIVVGPYGTGKSLLGTLVGSLVSNEIDKKDTNALVEKFNYVDEEIYLEFKSLQKNNKRYIPIILNGNEGKLRYSILSSLIKALNREKHDIIVPGIVTSIINTIEGWEKNFPDTFHSFQMLLKSIGKDYKEWKYDIQNYNIENIKWFRDVFPRFSSGVELPVDYKEDLIEQIRYVINELSKMNLGLFLIYDEFGRFLQNLEPADIHETMQDLQDLAELATDKSNSFHILLITHRNMRQYGLKYNEELGHEFDRIEKRYRVYNVESDKATFVRLSYEFLKNTHTKGRISSSGERIDIIQSGLRKFPLFSDLNQYELENFIIKGSYPLHPVSLYLLPYLSNVLAQNERTLFTFLESDEVGGLIRHQKKSSDWYLPHILFDYFHPSLVAYKDSYEMFLYNKVTSRHHLDKYEMAVLKFITLWDIATQRSEFNMTIELIAFANNWTEVKTHKVLENLKNKKIIRFHNNRESWEIFEGSAIDVNEVINKKNETNSLTTYQKLSYYNSNLTKHFYLPLDYNDEKSMTRFASVTFVYATDVIGEKIDITNLRKEKDADALIIYILGEPGVETDLILKKLNQQNIDKLTYFCISKLNNVDDLISKLSVVEELLDDKVFLQKDKPYLKMELEFIKEDINSEIEKFTKHYSSFDKKTIWIYQGKQLRLKNSSQLEKQVSTLMSNIFYLTPEVRNDSFNRRKIHSVQKNAAIKVLDGILSEYEAKNIGIVGNGPDYLIYVSVLRNNNIDLLNLNNIENTEIRELRNRLLTKLREKEHGSIKELVNIFLDEPFGIRKPLIPIIAVALLRDVWNKLIFYSNGMYVDTSKGSNIYEMMINNNENYTYDFFEIDNKYLNLLNDLENTFGYFLLRGSANKHRPILVCESMLEWLRSLPRISQMTNNVSPSVIELRKIIRGSEVAPIDAIEKIYNADKEISNTNYFAELKCELEDFDERHRLDLENKIFNVICVNDYSSLKNWAIKQDPKIQKNNPIVNVIINSNEDNWIGRLCLSLVGVERQNWSDTTDAMFETQLRNEIYKIINNNEYEDAISVSMEGNTKVINRVELSPKSNDIYNNAKRLIKTAGRNVPKAEIEFLLYKLFKEALE